MACVDGMAKRVALSSPAHLDLRPAADLRVQRSVHRHHPGRLELDADQEVEDRLAAGGQLSRSSPMLVTGEASLRVARLSTAAMGASERVGTQQDALGGEDVRLYW